MQQQDFVPITKNGSMIESALFMLSDMFIIFELVLLSLLHTYRQGLHIADCISCRRIRPLPHYTHKNEYDTLTATDNEVSLLEVCGVPLHCYYSQVNSASQWYYLLGFYEIAHIK